MVEFGGYDMPIQYTGILEEHKAVRNKAGVFDVSHMGEFEIRGADAQAFVQRMTTNDTSKLSDGKAQYSLLCYADGGIVDDLLVYRFEEHFMLVVNAANIGKDLEWLKSNRSKLRVEIVDRSEETALLAVQGPKAASIIQPLTATDLGPIGYYHFTQGEVAGRRAIISRTGHVWHPMGSPSGLARGSSAPAESNPAAAALFFESSFTHENGNTMAKKNTKAGINSFSAVVSHLSFAISESSTRRSRSARATSRLKLSLACAISASVNSTYSDGALLRACAKPWFIAQSLPVQPAGRSLPEIISRRSSRPQDIAARRAASAVPSLL